MKLQADRKSFVRPLDGFYDPDPVRLRVSGHSKTGILYAFYSLMFQEGQPLSVSVLKIAAKREPSASRKYRT